MNRHFQRATRITVAVATTVAVTILPATAAQADPGEPGSAPALSPFDLADTRGIRISQYELSIDRGGWTDGFTAFWGTMVTGGWEIYRWWIGMVCWLLDWAISFSWVELLTTPMVKLGEIIETRVIGPSNLMAACLVFAGLGIAIFLLRGHYGRATIELGIAAVVFALATTGLANPVTWVSGPNGPLFDARDAGIELANIVTSDGAVSSADPAALKLNTTAVMVDIFVRKPHQLLNYGGDIDADAACVPVYDKALKAGPYGSSDSAARDQIGKCNKGYKKYAESPGPDQMATQGFLMPAAGLLTLMIGLLTVLMMASVALTTWTAIKLLWHTIVGMIPGTARRGLAKSLAEVLVHLIMIPILLLFLCGYLNVLKSVMSANANLALIARYISADLILLVGLIILWRLWRNHTQISERFADLFNRASDAARQVNLKDHARLAHTLNRSSNNKAVQGWAGPGQASAAGAGTAGPGTAAHATAAGGPRLKAASGKIRGRMQSNALGREVLGIGRDTKATGAFLGKAGKTAIKYTAGAPVSYPAAAANASYKWSQASAARKAQLNQKLSAAGAYADTWLNNASAPGRAVGRSAGKAASGPANAAKTGAVKVGVAALKKSHPAIATAALVASAVSKHSDATPQSINRPDRKPRTRANTGGKIRPPESTPAVVPDIGPRRPVQARRAQQMRDHLATFTKKGQNE